MKSLIQKFVDDTPIWWKTILTVAIPTVLFMVTLFLVNDMKTRSNQTMKSVQEIFEMDNLIQNVVKLTVDLETGTRGYRLTGDESFLEPYRKGRTELPKILNLLNADALKNNKQSQLINDLEILVNEKMSKQVEIRNLPTKASQAVVTRQILEGKIIMDKIRKIADQLTNIKKQHLTEQSTYLNTLQARINNLLTFLFIIGLLVGILLVYLISISVTRRIAVLKLNARQIINDEQVTESPHGKDEIGMLSQSLHEMNHILIERERAVREAQDTQEKLNQQLQRQVVEITDINKELEAFSYSVSHDLRAPLRHVAGFSELMMKNSTNLDERNQRYLTIIVNSIRQMGTLIDDLLSFSRMGRAALKSDPIDLNSIIKEILHELLSETDAKQIEWNIEKLPIVNGDRSMIRLVMQNLVGNAIKYSSPKPHPKIEIMDVTQPDDDDFVIKIKDNGAGFDMKYVDKLFGVFQRLHRSEEFEGTGIGLATVRRIIQRHGGRVSAVGTPGEGAEFTFTLPQLRRNN